MTLNNLISGQAIIAVFKSSTSQEFFFIYLEVELEVNLGGCLLSWVRLVVLNKCIVTDLLPVIIMLHVLI